MKLKETNKSIEFQIVERKHRIAIKELEEQKRFLVNEVTALKVVIIKYKNIERKLVSEDALEQIRKHPEVKKHLKKVVKIAMDEVIYNHDY